MIFAYFTLFVALVIESVGAFYSISGLAAIFSGAVVPILIMGGSLEIGKVVAAVWLKNNWHRANLAYKSYLLPAVATLMLITSMGIFGFLSKAHSDQGLASGDVQAKIAVYDEKIRTERENIDANRRALKQMDEAVDQVMGRSTDEKGADKAVAIRRSQQKERGRLLAEITDSQKKITALNEERAPIAAEVRKVEADVGPIKYIAKVIYGDNPDANILEKAVSWVIMIIVAVFDPLALVLILAAQQSMRWAQEDRPVSVEPAQKAEETPKTDFEGVRTPNGDWIQTGPEFVVPEMAAEPEPDTSADMAQAMNDAYSDPVAHAAGVAPPNLGLLQTISVEGTEGDEPINNSYDPEVEYVIIGDADEEETKPTAYMQPMPFTTIQHKPSEPEPEPEPEPVIEAEPEPEKFVPREAAPGPNRRVMHAHLLPTADNSEELPRGSHSDFGNQFPDEPEKGDLYLRTDFLPNRLFKFNGDRWLEVDKRQTDVYAYEEAYIRHLISEIDAGRYDLDTLTDTEQEQIRQYLNKS